MTKISLPVKDERELKAAIDLVIEYANDSNNA